MAAGIGSPNATAVSLNFLGLSAASKPPCARNVIDLTAAPSLGSTTLDPAAYNVMTCAKDFAVVSAGPDLSNQTVPTLILRHHNGSWQLRSIGYPADYPLDIYLGIFSDDCHYLGLDKVGMTCRVPRGSHPTLTQVTQLNSTTITLADGRVLPVAADAVIVSSASGVMPSTNAPEFRTDYASWLAKADKYNPQHILLLWIKGNTITALSLTNSIDGAALS